jgi:hypothetical protein
MLIRYTVHVDPDVSSAAVDALVRLSDRRDRRDLAVKQLASFLFSIQDRPVDVLERVLKVTVALLGGWTAGDVSSFGENPSPDDAELLLAWSRMQELDTLGLVFLCNYSSAIRKYAVMILNSARQQMQFGHDASSHDQPTATCLMDIIDNKGATILQRVRFDQNGDGENKESDTTEFLRILQSDSATDAHLWGKCFPLFVKYCLDAQPATVHRCWEHLCPRLFALAPSVAIASDPSRNQNATLTGKWSRSSPANDEMIEQWRFYLSFGCVCVIKTDQVARKGFLKKALGGLSSSKSTNSLASAQEIFEMALPLLSSEKNSIRFAVVYALGFCNRAIIPVLIESMQDIFKSVNDDMRARYQRGSQRRVKRLERLRAEITHMLLLITEHVMDNDTSFDDKLAGFLVGFIRELGAFLSDSEVQLEWDHQMLRYYFCGLVERAYSKFASHAKSGSVVPFDLRLSLFNLFQEWCGYGQRGTLMREREAKMIVSVLEQVRDIRERGAVTTAMEDQRKALELSALKAMVFTITPFFQLWLLVLPEVLIVRCPYAKDHCSSRISPMDSICLPCLNGSKPCLIAAKRDRSPWLAVLWSHCCSTT